MDHDVKPQEPLSPTEFASKHGDAQDSRTSDDSSPTLETLRLMHGAASARWANRREYEWKLSYAIWTALAGFIASIVLGKDSSFEPLHLIPINPEALLMLIGLTAPSLVHWYYLNGMILRTLNDMDLFNDIEIALRKYDRWIEKEVPPDHLNSTFLASTDKSRLGRIGRPRGYGLKAQVAITILLSVAAAWFVFRERRPVTSPVVQAQPISVVCQAPQPSPSLQPAAKARVKIR